MNVLDGYLLDGWPPKDEAIAMLLREKAASDRAQPFYRALDLLGSRVPDETLMALRIALAGRTPDDDAIRTMRAQVAAARRGDPQARADYLASLETSR